MAFPIRYVHLRTVDPSASASPDKTEIIGLSMWRIALAASQETLQTGLMTNAWLRLFSDQLSRLEVEWLRWQDMGNSAEIRRAQSALYGRYLARGILSARLPIRYFVPLGRKTTRLTNGVVVARTDAGDIPDWIAWSGGGSGSYVLGEAKGALTGSEASFSAPNTPKCVANGKDQFARVITRDPTGAPLSTNNWVVANLWSTDKNQREPRIAMWDPSVNGRTLSPDEAPEHREAIARTWLASMAIGLGRPALRSLRRSSDTTDPGKLFRITAQPDATAAKLTTSASDRNADRSKRISDTPSDEPHEGVYSIGIFGPNGVSAINSADELERARKTALPRRPIMVIGLDRLAIKVPGLALRDWIGEAGIVTSEGFCLFDLNKIEIELVQ